MTYWGIGQLIVEDEQGGEARPEYGKAVLKDLAKDLTARYGKGFDLTNLRKMRQFYLTFPIRDAVRLELGWTHYRILMKIESLSAREWYMKEAVASNWSTRALERQVGSLYYERILASSDKSSVETEASQKTNASDESSKESPKEVLRDPYILDFLGLPGLGKLLESDLEQALMDHLQSFLLELGRGFAFVGRQERISTESKDFYIDLVFYNFRLKCFVLIDLKRGELSHQDIGQMDMYVRMYDELRKDESDNPTVGMVLCTGVDESIVHFSVMKENERLFASKYKLILPNEDELRRELEAERVKIDSLKED